MSPSLFYLILTQLLILVMLSMFSMQEITQKLETCSDEILEQLKKELNRFDLLVWRYFRCNHEGEHLDKNIDNRIQIYDYFCTLYSLSTIGPFSSKEQQFIMIDYENFQFTKTFIEKKEQEKKERDAILFRNALRERIPNLLQECKYEDIIDLKNVTQMYKKELTRYHDIPFNLPSWISQNWKGKSDIFKYVEQHEILTNDVLLQTVSKNIDQREKDFNLLLANKNIEELFHVVSEQSTTKLCSFYDNKNTRRLRSEITCKRAIKAEGHYIDDVLRYVDASYFDMYSFDWIKDILRYPFQELSFFNGIYPSFINAIITADYIKHHLVKTQNALIGCGPMICEILLHHQIQKGMIRHDIKNLIKVNKYFASFLANFDTHFGSATKVGCGKGCGRKIVIGKNSVIRILPSCAYCDNLKVYKQGEKILGKESANSWVECIRCKGLFYLPHDNSYKGSSPRCDLCLRGIKY